jgi:hypothetical protein
MINFEDIPINEVETRRSHSNDNFEELIKNFG